MRRFHSCPYCDREADELLTSNGFPTYTCIDCAADESLASDEFPVYKCLDCMDETPFCVYCGPPCPKCGSSNYVEFGRVRRELVSGR